MKIKTLIALLIKPKQIIETSNKLAIKLLRPVHTSTKLTRRCLDDNETLKKFWFTLSETMRYFIQ